MKKTSKNKDQKANLWQNSIRFSKAIWNNHDFWIKTLAVKGGATAIVIAGISGISYALSLPFILPAIVIGISFAFIGIGVYGIALGTTRALDTIKDTYYKSFSKNPLKKKIIKKHEKKHLTNKYIKAISKNPLVKKILNTQSWKEADKLTERQKTLFLTGLAGTGSAFWFITSLVSIITKIVILPILVVGNLLTFGTILAIGGVISGLYGLFISIKTLIKMFK